MKFFIKLILRNFGWYSFERDFLYKYMPEKSVGAEIGVWKGDFTKQVLTKISLAKYYLIDPWAFQPEFKERMYGGDIAKSQEDMDTIYEQVKKDLNSYSVVQYIRAFSDVAATKISDGELDWVYIDGNHYYDFVLKDLELYLPKVKVGGYVIGDDYHWKPNKTGDCEVRRAVNDFVKNSPHVEFVEIRDSQYVLERIK